MAAKDTQDAQPQPKTADDLPEDVRSKLPPELQNAKFATADDLRASAAAAQKAIEASGLARKLFSTAQTIRDPAKREKMLTDAYNKEIEAHGNSKKARMFTSGGFQGAVGGAGIGGAVSAGLGTVVGTVTGTLLGTVTAIPATALGGLTGLAVGAWHGPWIKLGKLTGKGGEKKEDGDNKGEEGKKEKGEKGEKGAGDEKSDEDDSVPDPEALRKAADELEQEEKKMKEKEAKNGGDASGGGAEGGEHDDAKPKEKKKPRKIEIRNKDGAKKE